MKLVSLLFIFTFGVFRIFGQSTTYVQFKILQVSNADEALRIDEKIKSKKGILTSKTDHLTSTYFCTLSYDSDYSENHFINWFKKLGYEITCFNKGVSGDGKMISPHELKECSESNK